MKAAIRSACACLAAWVVFSGPDSYAAVIFPNPPVDARLFARTFVSELLKINTNAFKGLQLKELTITNSLPMYSVEKQDVISGKLLSNAKLLGWQYLVWHGTNLIAFVPLDIGSTSEKKIKFAGITMDSGNQTINALNSAQGLVQVQKQNYEMRYLVEGLSFRMLWLHGKADDIVIPLKPTYGIMKPYCPYSEVQMIGFLKPCLEQTDWFK